MNFLRSRFEASFLKKPLRGFSLKIFQILTQVFYTGCRAQIPLFSAENDVRFDLSEDFKNQEFQLCVDKFVESMVAADEFGKYPTEDQISGTIRVYGPSQINEKFETIIGELRWTISLMTVPAEKPKEPVKKVEKPKARRVTRVRIKVRSF